MPALVDFSSLSAEQLSQMLKDYDVTVGPINAATRKTYERKLEKLMTGRISFPSHQYEPVPNDEDGEDEEVIIRQPAQNSPRAAEPPQTRQRKETTDTATLTPRIESRPSLSTSKKTTTSYTPATTETEDHYSKLQDTKAPSEIPVWIKLVFAAVLLVLVFLIYTNMEPTAKNEIPSIGNTVEV